MGAGDHGLGHEHEHEHEHNFGGHFHGDSETPHSKSAGGARALLIALVLIGVFALVEFLGGLWSGSLALMADAGHMVTDAAALAFSLTAHVLAQRPPSERHSYGLARAEVMAAFVNSLGLLAVVAWLVVEGVHRIVNPHPVNGTAVAVIATTGIVVNMVVAWFLSRDKTNLNMRAALLHVLGDLLGSVAALISGLVIVFTGYLVVDPLLSMLVGGLILRSTVGVLRESTLVLLDSVPEEVDYRKLGHALAGLEGVLSVHDLHVWSMIPGRAALSAHLLIEHVDQWPRVLHDARVLLRQRFRIDHATLQPEWLPDQVPGKIKLRVEE